MMEVSFIGCISSDPPVRSDELITFQKRNNFQRESGSITMTICFSRLA